METTESNLQWYKKVEELWKEKKIQKSHLLTQTKFPLISVKILNDKAI